MKLQIILNRNDIKLELLEGERVVAERAWEGELTLSEKLLVEIDEMLQKAGVSKDKVTKAEAVIVEGSGVTSARIVQTVADAWNVASK